jgi:hypothetical protein
MDYRVHTGTMMIGEVIGKNEDPPPQGLSGARRGRWLIAAPR